MAWVHSEAFGQSAEWGVVDVDPSAGAGLAANAGSFAMLDTGRGQWLKVGAADTAWVPLGFAQAAAAAPTVNEDADDGYQVGSVYVDTSTTPPTTYVCLDNTATAAVWREHTGMTLAAAIPTVTDDSDAGHAIGSQWYATGTNRLYTCVDASIGAAVWFVDGPIFDAAAPGVGDDDADLIPVGQIWIDQTNDAQYQCADNSTGAAVWQQTVAAETRDYVINGRFRATYDFATDGGAVGANAFGPTFPDNTVIVHASYEVQTTFTSPTGPDNATVGLGVTTDDAQGLVALAVINVGTPWDATGAIVDTLAVGTAAGQTTKTTAARQLNLQVGVEDITAGRLVVTGYYHVGE
jgi:hypothetical protein